MRQFGPGEVTCPRAYAGPVSPVSDILNRGPVTGLNTKGS